MALPYSKYIYIYISLLTNIYTYTNIPTYRVFSGSLLDTTSAVVAVTPFGSRTFATI